MKHVIIILLLIGHYSYSQKTTRQTVADARGVTVSRNITERSGVPDTLFLMMGQNAKYTHITDIVMVKHGSANDINELLTECMKFLSEQDGSSLEYKGNTLMSMGGKQIMLFGSGRDKLGYILLNARIITKLQEDLQAHLK